MKIFLMEPLSSYYSIDTLVGLKSGSKVEVEMFPVHDHPVKSYRYAEIMDVLPVVLSYMTGEDSCSLRHIPRIAQA